jgi:GAF domain-containing protein
VLYISFKEKRRFPPEDLALVQMLANYASTAIYRAELLNQRAAVTEIARDITSVLDRDKLLQQTLERSLEILSCEFGSISVFDPESQLLRFRYAVGKPSNMHVEMGEGLIGTAAETRVTVRVADVSKDKRYVEHIGETRSELDVPMLVGNRLVGVLNAESSRLNAFSEEDEQLAVALAAQAAVAFHTAELYEEAQARLQERVDDIQALQGIYALIGTAPTEDMLQEIAEEAARLTPAKYTGLWLLDERAGDLQFGAMNERAEAAAQRPPGLSLDESSISGHVALTGETYRCDDVRGDPYYQRWYEDTRSELATPLIHGDEVIGILNLESTEVGAFTEDHERLVEALAGAAVVAAHLYEQFERRVEELAALNEVGQTLTSGIRLDENQILELIHEQAKKLTGAQDMYIALYDEGTNVIRFGLATEHGERVDYEAREADMDERGKTEEVIFTRQPILHRTLEESKAWYGQPGHQEFIGRIQSSYLGVPLVAGEKVLGMIALYDWDREYAYDGRDLQTFSSMAGQAAIALDNATLYYDVIQRLEALNEVGQTLTSGIRLGEDEILELIYEQAKKLTGAQDMYIALYDEGTNLIRFGLATEHGERVDYEAREAGMDERGKTEEVIFTRQPILHRTLEESKAWYGKLGHQEFIGRVAPSWLGVPLVAGEKVLGMIALYDWDREYAYDGRDLQTFSSMAGQAAIALDNASLLEETRKLRDEVIATKQLATLGTAIAALQHRISNTFNIIVPNVTRLRRRVDMTDETIVEILDIIERNARYTSEIVTRIQEPLREVKIQDVNVNGVLDEVIGITEEQWPDVVIEQNLDDDIPLIQAPIGQVAEVFRNLSDNACRAMDGNGRLVITSCLDGGIISVRVRDMGSGIPPRIQERLFERPVPSKVPGGGAGLGLWLGQLMLQTIGGEVEIERTDSTGTTMLVRIPASGAEGGVQL